MHTLLLLLTLSVPLNITLYADDWPDSTQSCYKGKCVTTPDPNAALAAFRAIKAEGQSKGTADSRTGLSTEVYIAAGAAGATTVGIAYGVGKRLAYNESLKQAARAADVLRRETVRVTRAITKSMEPELARFGKALIEANVKRGEQGLAQLSSAEMEKALFNGLNSPEVKARIIARLRAAIGTAAESTFDKLVADRSIAVLAKEVGMAQQLGAHIGMEGMIARVGESMAVRVAESTGPVVARYTTRAALAAAAGAAERGLLTRCLMGFGRLGLGAVEAAASAPVLAAMILLDSSNVSAGTMDAFYSEHPEELLTLPEEQAASWIRGYPRVAGAVLKVQAVMQQNGDLGSISSEKPSAPAEDNGLVACLTQPAPAAAATDDGVCR